MWNWLSIRLFFKSILLKSLFHWKNSASCLYFNISLGLFLQCHLSLVPIYACTKKRTLADFSKTIVVALGLCFITYTVTASFGYLTFGSCVMDDILSSYKATPDVLVAVIVIAIKMYTTYPILLFVGRSLFISSFTKFLLAFLIACVGGPCSSCSLFRPCKNLTDWFFGSFVSCLNMHCACSFYLLHNVWQQLLSDGVLVCSALALKLCWGIGLNLQAVLNVAIRAVKSNSNIGLPVS